MVERIRLFRIANTVLLGGIVLLVTTALLLVPSFLTIAHRYSLVTDQVGALVQNEKMVSDVDVAEFQKKVEAVEQKLTRAATSEPLMYIETVRTLAPKGITINRFSVSGETLVEVYGKTVSRDIFQSFIDTLSADQRVVRVDNPLSNLLKTKDGEFKITVTFKK